MLTVKIFMMYFFLNHLIFGASLMRHYQLLQNEPFVNLWHNSYFCVEVLTKSNQFSENHKAFSSYQKTPETLDVQNYQFHTKDTKSSYDINVFCFQHKISTKN